MTQILNVFSSDEAKYYLASIVDSSDDAIIGKTLDGTIVSWNAAAERIFGYTQKEALGKHISLIIPKEKTDEEFIILGKVKEGKRIEHFETKRRTKKGDLIDISLTVSPIKNEAGNIIGASKVARDIRHLKKAEETSAYLAAIVDSSDDAIISKNLDGIITSWNKSATKIFGYTQEEAIGKHISLIIPAERMDEEYAILGKVKSGLKVDHFETKRRTKNGEFIDISLTVSPIRNALGTIIGASKIGRDITNQKKTEEELRETNKRKDEFLANISHELRTPMNAVIGLAHILGMSTSMTEKEKQFVTTLKQSAENLLVLINNLLDYSKFENNSFQLEEVEFSVNEILDKTLNITGVKAREKHLPIQVTYGPEIKKYYIGDAFRFQQILTNLVSNAVKFTESGKIEINITNRNIDADSTMLIIEVKDTGIGIDEDKTQYIFEKFTQADASTTRKFGGSGLGLSICKAFTEKMGGTISVESRLGLGSSFKVELPFRNSANQAVIESNIPENEQSRKNVLVVDDYPPNVMVVTAMLEQYGYSYDTAENGIEAVQTFSNGKYDVVLMDVQMHEMDGFEATTRIRAYEQERKLAKTPIIAMTAHVMERDKHKCREVGMDDFIPKPFDPKMLASKLEGIIAS